MSPTQVREEAGVKVAPEAIVYHSSQPWPNGPAGQMMLGFLAVAESESLAVDTEELETASWVDMATGDRSAVLVRRGGQWGRPGLSSKFLK